MSGFNGGNLGGRIGTSFMHGLGTAGVITVLAPGSNTNGVMLHTARLEGYANTLVLAADTAAPASISDASKRFIARLGAASMGATIRDVFIPPGMGIYVVADGSSCVYALTFDVL